MVSRKLRSSNGQLGRAVINARDKALKKHSRRNHDGQLIDPAPSTPHLNVDSITDENDLEAFLSTAQLAGTEFTAERYSGHIVASNENQLVGFMTVEEGRDLKKLQEEYESELRIPRRPVWHKGIDAATQQALENEALLEWRRGLSILQEVNGLHLTPFERNPELWKQLWRVIERSDLIVQIVDARNPLLFRSKDLEKYVTEVDPRKKLLILINKADLLTQHQRLVWGKYLQSQRLQFVFWSALEDPKSSEIAKPKERTSQSTDYTSLEARLKALMKDEEDDNEDADDDDEDDNEDDEEEVGADDECSDDSDATIIDEYQTKSTESSNMQEESGCMNDPSLNLSKLVNVSELLEIFSNMRCDLGGSMTVGMVGYPNVGKSSSINRIFGQKKVPVSETPGKTRHLQTLPIDDRVTLCDCPGLVMPSLALSKGEMIVNGILPVDQMKDCYPPIGLLISRFPHEVWEKHFHITLPKKSTQDNSYLSPHDLLTAVAFMRGFMSSKGIPDCSRAGRMIVKAVISGSLCWAQPPPNLTLEEADSFNNFDLEIVKTDNIVGLEQLQKRRLLQHGGGSEKVDAQFFTTRPSSSHTLTATQGRNDTANASASKRHNNKNKKQKLKRIYTDLNP